MLKRILVLIIVSICLIGCGNSSLNNTETTENSNEVFSYQATDGVISYKFAKVDGDYSELSVDKDLGITSKKIEETFNNFWSLSETNKELDKGSVKLVEEDILTYKDGRTCHYIFYDNGLVDYSDSQGVKAILEWKSDYVK